VATFHLKSPLKNSIIAVPVVVVFTNYDRLVRMYTEDREKAAQSVFDVHVKSLQDAAIRLEIEMPKYINVSGVSVFARRYVV
jgi:hypothetical protein